ncbi:MAG: MATE family efflux transporter [Schwartzia sp.]|nr:MATE family efflux transporter [Schwartzia sp. (in: firmicutes)]
MGSKGRLFSGKHLAQLIWPLAVEQLLSVLIGMVDVLMVAFIGEAAVSGVSLVDSVNFLILQVLFAMTAGGTVVCAKYIGGGETVSAKKSGGQLLSVTTFAMLLLSLLLLFGGEPVLRLLFGTVTPEVMENAEIYMRFTVASFPFLALYHSAASIFRAEGNTRLSMLVSLGMNLLTIVGNAICIFGFGMGVEGVAIPTLLSRAVGAAAICLFLQAPDNALRIDSLKQCRPNGTILRQILSIGVPGSVESGLFNLGKVMLQSLVSTLGTASIAAYAVASNLATYLYLPGNALGAALMIVVGRCNGANEPAQAKHYTKLLVLLNYAALVPICAVMILGRSTWVGLYNLSSQSAYFAEGLILSHSLAMIIWPVAFILPYYFRASGKAVFSMAVAIGTMLVFRIGCAYLFVDFLGKDVLWVWYAMFIDWIFRVFLFAAAFRKMKPI